LRIGRFAFLAVYRKHALSGQNFTKFHRYYDFCRANTSSQPTD
jgi:hypothetical protein